MRMDASINNNLPKVSGNFTKYLSATTRRATSSSIVKITQSLKFIPAYPFKSDTGEGVWYWERRKVGLRGSPVHFAASPTPVAHCVPLAPKCTDLGYNEFTKN